LEVPSIEPRVAGCEPGTLSFVYEGPRRTFQSSLPLSFTDSSNLTKSF